MKTPNEDIVINQGAGFIWDLVFDETQDLSFLDNASVRMQIRSRRNLQGELILDLFAEGFIAIQGNTIKISIPGSVTKGFSFTKAYYDILLLVDSGEPFRILGGGVTISKGVTSYV